MTDRAPLHIRLRMILVLAAGSWVCLYLAYKLVWAVFSQ